MSLRMIRYLQRVVDKRQTYAIKSNRSFARIVRDEDKGKIPVHVAVFTFLLLPCIAYSAVFYSGRDARQDELEEKIRERYGEKVQEATTKNRAMSDFYQQAIVNAESGAQDDRLQQVLYGGKGEKKRFHAIDKELYGTLQGVEEKRKTEEELEKERKRKRRQKRKAEVESENTGASETGITDKIFPETSVEVTPTTVAVIAIVAVVAIANLFLGGSRR